MGLSSTYGPALPAIFTGPKANWDFTTSGMYQSDLQNLLGQLQKPTPPQPHPSIEQIDDALTLLSTLTPDSEYEKTAIEDIEESLHSALKCLGQK